MVKLAGFKLKAMATLLLSTLPFTCAASSGLEFSYGYIPAKNERYDSGASWRLSYLQGIDTTDTFLDNYGIGLRLELSVQRWEDNSPKSKHESNHVFSLNPIFQYQWHFKPMSLYLELGIGVAYVNNTLYLDRDLGSNWLFEDKLGLGLIVNKHHRIGLSYSHYSNAELASANDGADLIGISYGYTW
ncbi:acyloxyacyl hydrolase [Shewanella sp. 0m-8]